MRAGTILVMRNRVVTAAETGRGKCAAGAEGEPMGACRAAPSGSQTPEAGTSEASAPEAGARASGHGASGVIAAVRARQPLSADGIWRVSLAGEPGGRLVRRKGEGSWQLLRVDDLTDAQLEAYESGMQQTPHPAAAVSNIARNAR